MKSWMQRVAAILFLAVGLACLFSPFRNYSTDSIAVKTIDVSSLGLARGGDEAASLWQMEKSSAYTVILNSLDDMIDGEGDVGRMRLVRTTVEEAAAFLPPKTDGDPVGDSAFSIVYRDHVFQVSNPMGWTARKVQSTGGAMTPGMEATLNVERRSKVVPVSSALIISDELAATWPILRSFLEGGKDPWEMELEDYPAWSEWAAFVGEAGGAPGPEDRTRVSIGGHIMDVQPAMRHVDVKSTVSGLKVGVKAAGAVFMVVGVILLAALYRRPPEDGAIQVGSPGFQFLGDLIVILISTLAAVAAVDYLLGRSFGVDLLVDDEFGYAMSAMFLLLAVPLVSLYQSLAAAQYLWVSREGLRLKSLFSDKGLSWDRLEKVRCKSVRMVTARAGMPMPRTMSRNLVLEGDGTQLSFIEPGKTQKHLIIRALLEHAPETWRETFEEVGKEWDVYVAW